MTEVESTTKKTEHDNSLPPWHVMFSVALVCLFVCLFVDSITQKVMNEILWRGPG